MFFIAPQLQCSRSAAERGRYTDFLILSTHRWRTGSALRLGRSRRTLIAFDPAASADFAA
jgi:hypothetical protein